MKSSDNHRRTFLKLGLGATAGLISTGLTCGTKETKALLQDSPEAAACTVTAQQTLGPFYPHLKNGDGDVDLTSIQGKEGQAEGEVILIRGRILDQDCQPIAGALVEIWQANHHGRYSHEGDADNPQPLDPNFEGWGQMKTEATGSYGFRTIKPAAYPVDPTDPVAWRTPHIHFRVSRRGYHEIVTQMYFEGEALNADDMILHGLPEAEQDDYVISPQPDSEGLPLCTFDLTLKKVPTAKDRLAELDACTGRYDMQVPFGQKGEGSLIRREDQRLLLDIPGYTTVELTPDGPDAFLALGISRRFVFNREPDGRVNSVVIHPAGHVQGLPMVAAKM